MEQIKEVISNLFERIRSPFYSTFIVSWCIVNWRIVFIAVSGDMSTTEKITQVEASLIKLEYSLYWPLGISILYFLVYRWVEVGAALYLNWQKAVRQDREFQQLKKHSVSGIEYFDLVGVLERQNELYSNIRSEKAISDNELNDVRKSLEEARRSESDLRNQIKNMASYSDQKNLIGEWTITFRKSNADEFASQQVVFRSINEDEIDFYLNVVGGSNRRGNVICFQNFGDSITFILKNDHNYQVIRCRVVKMNELTKQYEILEGTSESNNGDYQWTKVRLERNP